MQVHCCDLASYETENRYEVLTSVMAFGHIKDMDGAFSKMKGLLRERGEFQIIVSDFDYFKTSRPGVSLDVEKIDEDSYVVQVTRTSGTIADIVRKLDQYDIAARNVWLTVREQTPVCPTDEFIADLPRFAPYRNRPIMHLLRIY